jgi:NTP pyrophosphatase (non-canonical NTP hydrolase)
MSLSIEASEISELFLWKSSQEIDDMLANPIKKEKVRDEIADVFAYLLRLSDKLDIDLVKAFYDKMEKNTKKYPIDKVKGNFKKYNELDD